MLRGLCRWVRRAFRGGHEGVWRESGGNLEGIWREFRGGPEGFILMLRGLCSWHPNISNRTFLNVRGGLCIPLVWAAPSTNADLRQ
eukprot:3661828-Pyramimonas_sp.AAC.1